MTGEANHALTAATDLAEQPLHRFLCLVPQNARSIDPKLRKFAESALVQAEAELEGATRDDFRRELTACLALCAATGMSEADRTEWLKAAWGTLNGIPADLLSLGCIAARRHCDHPSKIVPTIIRETEAMWSARRGRRSDVLAAIAKMEDPQLAKEERCTPEQARQIRKALNLKIDDDEPQRSPDYVPVEQRPAPTRADYLRWGIDPDQDQAA